MANWYDGVPAPVDRDGNVVPLTTKVMYDDNGVEGTVQMFMFSRYDGKWVASIKRETIKTGYETALLHLHRPDSLEKLADDLGRYEAAKSPCAYFDCMGKTCAGCPVEALSDCKYCVLDDVARRVAALRKRDAKEAR